MRKVLSIFVFCLLIISSLTACIFEEEDERLKVVFNTAGGSSIEAVEVLYGSAVEKPKDPTKDGYVFAGWYLGDNLYDFTKPVKRHITLTAKWVKEGEEPIFFTVKFNTDGDGQIDSQKVEVNSTAKRPNDPQKQGFEFLGWYLGEELFDFSKPITSDITLIAKWKEIVVEEQKTFTVTFDLGEHLDGFSVKINENNTVAKPTDPYLEGYLFCGWFIGKERFDFSAPITGDITLIAVWELLEVETVNYTVTFNCRNGDTFEVEVEENKLVGIPQDPEMDGYKFLGWFLDGERFDFLTPITEDLTVYADWEIIEVKINYFCVRFDSKGGSLIEDQNVEEGERAIAPQSPQKDGYDFAGWYLDGALYDFSLPITKNVTIEAVWIEKMPNYYTVNFDSYGGSEVESQTVKENGLAKEIVGYKRDGFEFIGWFLGDERFDFSSPITKDITLVARWRGEVDISPLAGVWQGEEDINGACYTHNLVLSEDNQHKWTYKNEFSSAKELVIDSIYCDGIYIIFEVRNKNGLSSRAIKFKFENNTLITESCFFGEQCVFGR